MKKTMYRLHTEGHHSDVTWKQLLFTLFHGTFPHLTNCGDIQSAVDSDVAWLSSDLREENERLTVRQFEVMNSLFALCAARAKFRFATNLAYSFAHRMQIVTVEVEQ